MHYYVIGVNGSGKTTLLKAIHEKTGMQVVHATSELMGRLRIPGNYTALREMDQADVLAEYGKMAAELPEQYGDKDFLLDTHILNLTNGKVISRDGPWMAKYDALVLIKAQPTTLLKRIESDIDKDRAMFSPDMSQEEKLKMIASYQAETEQLFTDVRDKFALSSLIIDNNSTVEDSVRHFIDFRRTLKH